MSARTVGIDSVPTTFWRQLAAARAAALMLDYDGTLAPFRVDRDRAEPYPGIRHRLARLQRADRTRLVIISGRSVADVGRLLAIDPQPEIWGMHGFERRVSGGELQRLPITPANRVGLAQAERAGVGVLSQDRIERKPAAVAFHWRGLSGEEILAVRRRLESGLAELTLDRGLELHAFDGGLELRVAGVSKARAVQRVQEEMDPPAALAYLGDDRTDEDAFRALAGRGLSVLVRADARPTAAQLRLVPPHDLTAFLDRWHAAREERVDG